MSTHLYTEKYGQVNRYRISRETDASYFLWMNDRYEQKVPKKTMKVGSGWNATWYQLETPALLARWTRQRKILEYQVKCEKLLKLQKPTDEIMDEVLAIVIPESEDEK